MLKVISYKGEGKSEVEILTYLSSEPVKSEPDNPIVPLIDILCHNHWIFSVQPRWSSSVDLELTNVSNAHTGLPYSDDKGEGISIPTVLLVA